MKKFTKITSIILAIIIVFSLFTALPFSAAAAENENYEVGANVDSADVGLESTGNGTIDSFINDYRFTDGTSWAWNKTPQIAYYDSQGCCAYCADYVKYCYGYNNPRTGSVFYSVSEIRAGDVLTVGNQSDGSGHWFICLKRSGNSLYVAEGNYSNRVRIGWNYTISGSGFAEDGRSFTAGYHYLSGNPDPPTNAWISASSSSIPVGGSITFSFGSNGGTNYWIGIDRNGSRVITEQVWSEKSYTFNEDGDYSAYVTADNAAGYVDSNRVYFTVQPKGHIMSESEGAGKTIPDGDYWICSKIAQDFFIDLPGDNIVSEDGANVSTWSWNDTPKKYDVFHIEYLNNGFYRISQLNSNMSMDIEYGSLYRDANIHMWTKHDGVSQQWSIEGSDKGYKIRSRCNAFYMDIDKGTHEGGTNVHVWESHNGDWQYYSFIPYNPNERPLADGVYRIDSAVGNTCNLDVSSVPGDYVENSNVQIWNNSNEHFKIEYAGNGYYRVYEATSMLAVEIINDDISYLDNNKNVRLNKKNNSREQFWAIKQNTDGSFAFINKLSGYYLDVYEDLAADGTNVHAHPYNGTNAQRWKPRRVLSDDMVTVKDVLAENNTTLVNPSVTVKVNNKTLTKNTDYSVEITADIAYGKGIALITGKGDYCGSITKEFSISIIPPKHEIGDTNLDGRIDIRDVTVIQRHIAELEFLAEVQLALADTNGDRKVDITDATHLQMYLAEYDVVLGKQS